MSLHWKSLGAASALALATLAQPAAAATIFPGNPTAVPGAVFTVFGNPDGSESITAIVGRGGLSASGTDIFRFAIGDNADPKGDPIGDGTGSVTTSRRIEISGLNGLDFTKVEFWNGATLFDIPIGLDGSGMSAESLGLIPIFEDVFNELRITYNVEAGSTNASYSGQLTFSPNAAVPEPATWAMMLVGFAAVGAALRRRRKETVRVRYAF